MECQFSYTSFEKISHKLIQIIFFSSTGPETRLCGDALLIGPSPFPPALLSFQTSFYFYPAGSFTCLKSWVHVAELAPAAGRGGKNILQTRLHEALAELRTLAEVTEEQDKEIERLTVRRHRCIQQCFRRSSLRREQGGPNCLHSPKSSGD